MSRRKRAAFLGLVSTICAGSPSANAAVHDSFWLGGNGDWNTAANWSEGVVPQNTASDQYNAYINTASNVSLAGGTVSLNSFSIGAPGQLAMTASGKMLLTAAGNVDGSVSLASSCTFQVGANQTISGSGTFSCLASGSTVRASMGTLTLSPGLTIHGRGAVGTINGPLINRATITADAPDAVLTVVGSGITNTGTLAATNSGILALAGSYTTAGLGDVSITGGKVRITGTLDNTGHTLTIANTSSWELGGTIVGGTLTTLPGAELITIPTVTKVPTGTLDNVILNGTAHVDYQFGSTVLSFPHGIHGSGKVIMSGLGAYLDVAGGDSNAPSIIDPGITVSGEGYFGATRLNNHGRIRAAAGKTLQVSNSFAPLLSDGVLELVSAAKLQTGDLSLGNGGALEVELNTDSPGLLQVLGNLDLSGEDYLTIRSLIARQSPTLIATYQGTLTGVFDHVTQGYSVTYGGGFVFLNGVPEPSGLMVGSLAGALVAGGRMRRSFVTTRRGGRGAVSE